VTAGRLRELEERRAHECRLTPDRALETIDEAAAWIHERGLVEITPCCSLPSLHAACHEEPYKPGGRGFAAYPRTKYPWGFELTRRPGFHAIRVHRGKRLLVTDRVAALVDPLARRALAGATGDERRLLDHLAAAGASTVEEIKEELGLDARALRAARTRLERAGAVVARTIVLETEDGGHRHTGELRRWDQVFAEPAGAAGGLEELVIAAVRAAVVAPERELRRWFSWPLEVIPERLERPAPGWVAAPASSWHGTARGNGDRA
jgi:DNA-binding Lrp family transcriptional regulator